LLDMFSCCSVAGDAAEVARALDHSSEERIKSAQAAISSPRRRYFRLNVQAMSSFARVWNVQAIWGHGFCRANDLLCQTGEQEKKAG